MMHIVLVNPEIPQNTGNIARTCAATGAMLHLIEPLGFELSDKYLKRAGLDYWHLMTYQVHANWEDFRAAWPEARLHYATTKGPRDYCQARYGADDFLVFGRETKGLDEALLAAHYDDCVRIPMRPDARSLNLANPWPSCSMRRCASRAFPASGARDACAAARPRAGNGRTTCNASGVFSARSGIVRPRVVFPSRERAKKCSFLS